MKPAITYELIHKDGNARYGTIETNQKFTFESSDPDLISFYSEDSGTFEVVSKETTDGIVLPDDEW